MVTYGLTSSGFVLKRLDIIKTEMEALLRAGLGNGINLLPTELLGQMVGIVSERAALEWEAAQAVYNAFSPSIASGVSLDNVVEITGIKRLQATKGKGSGYAYGTLGITIPKGSILSVAGNSDAKFVTVAGATIGAGTNEVQDIDFSAVPDAGNWTLSFDGEETGQLAFNDNAAAVQATLNGLQNLSGVTVAGNYTNGFTVTFSGADGQKDQPMLQVGTNTLTKLGTQVNMTIAETTKGVLPNVLVLLEAQTAGKIVAYANTLTVIETPIAGWTSFNNLTDIDPGKNIETDSELRLRREKTLSTAGAATLDAIRSRILEIDAVDDCKVFHNINLIPDAQGRPGKSVEAVVLGGTDQDIANAIWATVAAGIETYGSVTKQVIDSQGYTHNVKFSRPTPVPIYFIVNIITDATFPVGGATSVKQAIADYGDENFNVGDDVITTRFFCPINTVQGITDIEVFIGTAPNPNSDANIAISDTQISTFDTANITVNVT